jgi:acetate kinase
MKALGAIDRVAELAPPHNPGCRAGTRAARLVFGSDLPMVAVFDTDFHRSIPPWAGEKSDFFSILLAAESIQWMKGL